MKSVQAEIESRRARGGQQYRGAWILAIRFECSKPHGYTETAA